jgi:hypothetical protein
MFESNGIVWDVFKKRERKRKRNDRTKRNSMNDIKRYFAMDTFPIAKLKTFIHTTM